MLAMIPNDTTIVNQVRARCLIAIPPGVGWGPEAKLLRTLRDGDTTIREIVSRPSFLDCTSCADPLLQRQNQ
jgi:hypothetical protein